MPGSQGGGGTALTVENLRRRDNLDSATLDSTATPTPLLPTTLAASTTLAAWCPAPKSFKIETKRPTEDRKGQRTTREQELDIGGRSVGPTVLVGPLVSAQDLDN